MIEIELQTNKGELVVVGIIPPFVTPPDVVVWGTRIFQKSVWPNQITNDNRPQYRECFAIAVVYTTDSFRKI